MLEIPSQIRERLRAAGEERIVADWGALAEADRVLLLELIQRLDLNQLKQFYADTGKRGAVPARERIRPAPVRSAHEPAARAVGEAALRAGEVAVVMVAGGRGTRLGFDHPKGMYPIGPVSRRSLFRIHAEKVLALRRRFECALPLLMMTSDATDAETREYFQRQQNFGLEDDVYVFRQGSLPAFELATGQPIRHKGRLRTSPNGHGGTLFGLHADGWLQRWRNESSIKHIFYFQVDNPLAKIADPTFLGQHILAQSEVSTKIIVKPKPTDPMGNVVYVDGHCSIVEYSDLSPEQALWQDDAGQYLFTAGNTGIHVFSVEFLARLMERRFPMPLHLARKQVSADGRDVAAVQFEMFIFDILPATERSLVVQTDPAEEFAPLKNESGADSPPVVRKALRDQYARWLAQTGVTAPVDWPIEISPLTALGPEDLAGRKDLGIRVDLPEI